MTNSTDSRVLAVVVTFLPKADGLVALIRALSPQVETVLVVDNSPRTEPGIDSLPLSIWIEFCNLRPLRLGENVGIASAQNLGIDIALKEGYGHVLLSDQDSLPAPEMVMSLLYCHARLAEQSINVGCICPQYLDNTTGQAFPFQIQRPGRLFYSNSRLGEADPWIEILTTISSGSLIPREALLHVGPMREDFFIDHVDTEWCHRARARGFRLYATSRANLSHRLGDASFQLWLFGWRPYSIYSRVRLYYRFRNFVLLCRLQHVRLLWKLRASWYWAGNFYAHAIFAPGPIGNIKAMIRGLIDGFRGRRGRFIP